VKGECGGNMIKFLVSYNFVRYRRIIRALVDAYAEKPAGKLRGKVFQLFCG